MVKMEHQEQMELKVLKVTKVMLETMELQVLMVHQELMVKMELQV
mgnify:CR=1 FL=1